MDPIEKSEYHLNILAFDMNTITDRIWSWTALGKAECVLYERNNKKDTGGRKGLAGYSPILLTVLEHTSGHLPDCSAVRLECCDEFGPIKHKDK